MYNKELTNQESKNLIMELYNINNKEFTNQELKKLIIELYNDKNIPIDEKLKNNLSKSSKVQYKTLLKYYYEIKNNIIESLIKNKLDEINIEIKEISNDIDEKINEKPIYIELKKTNEIEIQTEDLTEENTLIINLKTENFNLKQIISNLKSKIINLKTEYKKQNKKQNINENNSQLSTSDDDNEIKEKRKFNYHELTELSSYNIIQELSKLNIHNLKQIYNKYYSFKHRRQLKNY